MKRLLLFIAVMFFSILSGQEMATAYKGRIRPVEAYARLWLYDIYHHQTIKSKHVNAFGVTSPEELIWKMNFLGHQNWDDTPLFWVHYAKLKSVVGLSTTEDYFSYHQLSKALYENEETNLKLVKPLLAYHFIKAYLDPSNRSRGEKIELTTLASGLWLKWNGSDIVVIYAPEGMLWNFLKPGMVILSNAKELLYSYHNDYKLVVEEALSLISLLHQYENIIVPPTSDNFSATLLNLKKTKQSPKEIALSLENQYPLTSRIEQSGTLLKVLPGSNYKGDWYPLNALNLKTYDVQRNILVPIPNFTLFSDAIFEEIQQAYFVLKANLSNKNIETLKSLLDKGYESLAGKPYKWAIGKSLTYPSWQQLQAENFYYRYPLTEIAIMLYVVGMGASLLIYARWPKVVYALLFIAFLFHTFILGVRCFILERPPVSNMFETVIYVPWITVLVSLLLWIKYRSRPLLFSASLAAVALLLLLKLTQLNASLENVQAVLDSQYWLLIHVLMVVGSYGAFILAGIMGHFYLLSYWKHNKETPELKFQAKLILQSMYLGVALLIPGTILGGVWAAESWGRFWDWDPKESWAFISSCIYLIGVHAYRFHYIHNFGLAVCSIAGLMTISFTWYGVNYILGTGLHSYGFGSGGEIYYYAYLLVEAGFLALMGIRRQVSQV